MLSARFKPYHVPLFLAKYAYLTARRRPILVHFEVTMRCNARCNFCDYWKTPAEAKEHELKSFADAARFFNPMMVTFTGGEPTLRRDLEDLVSAVSNAIQIKYITMITHGGMLTPERAWSLWQAGINQFNISLDYLDGRHDTARGIPGLTAKIFKNVAVMRERGIDSIRFNSVIKDDNLDQVLPIAHHAAELGCGVNYSVYTDSKNGSKEHLIRDDQLAAIDKVVAELLAFKRKRSRHHHELRLLHRADPALCARGDEGAVSGRHPHDPHRSDGSREALPGLPGGLSLDGLQGVQADRLQRLLLCVPW
jgi:MoaA/NifB/PqqE/SkfB family radical SAM enzyme